MRRIFEYIRKFDLTFISHSEDEFLSRDGVMNEGEYSIKLGMKGIPDETESIMVGRDILLCEMTKSKLHIAHVSTEGSMILIEGAKSRGVDVTVEVTPHHFILTDEEVEKQSYSTNTKVNPPLRSAKNRDKMLEYIKRGVIDMIVTDHAPHTKVDKSVEYDRAPFGMTGLETSVGLVVTYLIKKGVIDLNRMAEMMSINPRKRFKIDGGLKIGKLANISIVDMDKEWIVEKENFYSKGKNTPFQGMKLVGKPYMTIVNGFVRMQDGNIIKY
jgi:dihydroorotase